MPYPVQIGNRRFKGTRFDFHSACGAECFQQRGHYTCAHGLSFIQRTINGENIVVGGFLLPGSPLLREKKGNWSIRSEKQEKILAWISRFTNLINSVISIRPDADALGPLHEINRWAAQVHAIAHRMLHKEKDRDFSENFISASRDLRSLYKASNMLVDAFDYLNIYYNPSSADFGKKRSVDLYKLVDKIRIILSEAEAAAQNKKIVMRGGLHCTVDVFESFKAIPFCFLQNAIKYSFDNEIAIRFESNAREVEMYVDSIGPVILDEERMRLFDKGYRGIWSKRIHHEGLGVGLYIAKIVADANDVEIKVKSVDRGYQRDGIPMALNSFGIKINLGRR